ncbi:MAG TPA: hypothetical protein VIV88_17440 [Gemmatimonadales bacterium]|jgi:hypothetical protein
MALVASRHWMLVLALSVVGARAPAQWLDPDACVTCPDKRIHFAAGVGLDVLARGPWVAKPFHDHAWKRVLITATVAASWEMLDALEARREGKAGRPGYGFGPLDFAATVAGAASAEALQALARKFLKRRRAGSP